VVTFERSCELNPARRISSYQRSAAVPVQFGLAKTRDSVKIGSFEMAEKADGRGHTDSIRHISPRFSTSLTEFVDGLVSLGSDSAPDEERT
jgi:hypothetical protein